MGGTDAAGDGQAPASVLVADRARAFAEALADLLTQAGCPATSVVFAEAAEACAAARPATLLVDGDAPLEDVEAVVVAARTARGDVRVILLVAAHGRTTRHLGELHADAIVTRQHGVEDVLAAIDGKPAPSTNGHRARQNGRRFDDGTPVDRLTPRERQVLQALMAGGRSAAIAEALRISPHTVRTHIQNTFAKLAVSTRLEAASVARDAGLRPLTLDEVREGNS